MAYLLAGAKVTILRRICSAGMKNVISRFARGDQRGELSNYKHFKHYYDPYDSLDVEWQNVVSKGHLTISEVVSLSGYTKSYVYRLVKDGVIPCMNGMSGKQVRWIAFIHWYSHLPETPASPIGEASFSIAGLIKLTGMGRCWLLIRFVTRYNVRSYNVGWLKRYIFRESQQVWTTHIPCGQTPQRYSFSQHSERPQSYYHSSHFCAVYPRYFVNLATIRTFASSNDGAARAEPNEFELCRATE